MDTLPLPAEAPFGRLERIAAVAYAAVLFYLNFYLCRGLFSFQATPMNSMHGFWMAIARWADGAWFQPQWWPYWDCGIPFEFTYAPLAPLLTALGSAVLHLPLGIALQWVSGLAYCLAPVALFLVAWLFMRSPGYSFLAALLYSLTAPTRILVPDDAFRWSSFWDARRLYLVAVWDDTPHVLALVFLPLAIVFLTLSVRKRRPIYYAAAAVSIALATLASAFGTTVIAMAGLCLAFVLQRHGVRGAVVRTAAIGAYGWALGARFLPPSLLHAMREASKRGEDGNWTMGSLTALAIVTLGWVLLWRYLPRWTRDWRMQFVALFAYLVSSPPALATFLNRHVLPQPNRYKFEMEMAWSLLVVFALKPWIDRLPRAIKGALLFLILALAGEQVVTMRKYSKALIQPGVLENTIESRAATWAQQNIPDTRILMPGSIAQWTNAFTPLQQFTGSSWSMAYNPIQQRGQDAAFFAAEAPEQDARISLAWLKAYGVGAVCVVGPKSPEFWKPYRHPQKYEGQLPVLWRADDTAIYQVPRRSASFAHVVPEWAVVRREPAGPADSAQIERFVGALEDPALPAADFRWEGRDRIRIHAATAPGQVIAIQVSYHPGWHATTAGRGVKLEKDGLGLMWLRPASAGPCDVQLDYDGGWEFRLCRWLGYLALAGVLAGLPAWYYRKRVKPSPAL